MVVYDNLSRTTKLVRYIVMCSYDDLNQPLVKTFCQRSKEKSLSEILLLSKSMEELLGKSMVLHKSFTPWTMTV